jgi:glycosyltransferase involved in cell wall biosynthesis
MRRVGILESGTGIGGAEVNIFSLAQPLRKRGWELVVLVPGEGTLTRALDQRGIPWHEIRAAPFKSTSRYWGRTKVMDPLAVLYDTAIILSQARAVTRLIREAKIELLQTNSMLSHLTGGLAAKWSRIPCVWHLQDIVGGKSGLGLFRRVLNLGARTLADTVICISEAVAQQLDSTRARRKGVIIFNGVDVDRFTPNGEAPYRAEWLGERYQFVVGQIGRLTPWKGQEFLLAAARCAKEDNLPVRFVIIGDDGFGQPGYRKQLGELAKRFDLGDRVIFAGWLEDIPGALRSLDLVVHATRAPEPFGLVVAEAMASGRPVVVADHGGAREVVGSNQNGRLVPPEDIQALYQAIRCLLNDPAESARIGSSARARVEANLALDRFADRMAGVYASLVKER